MYTSLYSWCVSLIMALLRAATCQKFYKILTVMVFLWHNVFVGLIKFIKNESEIWDTLDGAMKNAASGDVMLYPSSVQKGKLCGDKGREDKDWTFWDVCHPEVKAPELWQVCSTVSLLY